MATLVIFDSLPKKKQYYFPIGLTQEIQTHFSFTIFKKQGDDSEVLSVLKPFEDIPSLPFIESLEAVKTEDKVDLIILINEPYLCEQIKYERKRFCRELEANKKLTIFLHQSLIKTDFIPHGIVFSNTENIDKTFSHEKISDFPIQFKHPLWQRIITASKTKLLVDLHRTNRYLTNLKYFLEFEINNENKVITNWSELNKELQVIDPLLNLNTIKNQLIKDIQQFENSIFIDIQTDLKEINSVLNCEKVDFEKLLKSVQTYLTKH